MTISKTGYLNLIMPSRKTYIEYQKKLLAGLFFSRQQFLCFLL